MAETLKARKDVDVSLTWDLSSIFATNEDFEKAVKEMQELSLNIEQKYKGKLTQAAVILSLIHIYARRL